jgi:hypothetical protein
MECGAHPRSEALHSHTEHRKITSCLGMTYLGLSFLSLRIAGNYLCPDVGLGPGPHHPLIPPKRGLGTQALKDTPNPLTLGWKDPRCLAGSASGLASSPESSL